jgi:NTE family protein
MACAGGGMKNLSFLGGIKALEEYSIDKQVKGLIGSSAGAILIGLFSVGYRSEDINGILNTTNFSSFKDSPYGYVGCLYRFINYYGLYLGDAFEKWYGDLIEQKTKNRNITFKDVYDNYKLELVIIGTNLSRRRAMHFCIDDTPDMPIVQAVRISMSYPIAFVPVVINKETFVDGGLSLNYDLHYFARKYPNLKSRQVIGMKTMASDEKPTKHIYSGNDKITNVLDFCQDLIETMQYQMDREYMSQEDWNNTIQIDIGSISALDFDLTPEEIASLIDAGYQATKKFLEARKNSS